MDEFPQLHWVILGAGDADYAGQLKNQAAELGLSGHLHWGPPLNDMPAVFNALDAVVLITHPDASAGSVSLADLRRMFTDEDSAVKLVFDSGNSSNLNLMLSRLGIKDFSRKNVVAAGGNQKVFDWVKKDKNAIGFVGYNLISEKSNEVTRELKNSVKILGVKDQGEAVVPSRPTILEQTYPFHRIIYLHTLGTAWGVENGFIRFACSKPGQLIAEKMGLVPYYAIPKEFVLSKESID
ncbi:MAG: hypothetical protein LRY55_01405 [Leadbetterella sp.]|nr:hypothetical protein [Leadbetterella sp.]